MKPCVAILIPAPMAGRTISSEEMRRLEGFARVKQGLLREPVSPEAAKETVAEADACITGWGSCALTGDILDAAPGLKLIAHAAGSVKGLVPAIAWERGILVTSAAAAIAVGVAEHALGLMLSAQKRSFWYNNNIHAGGWSDAEEYGKIREMYGIIVGVVGTGHVGRNFIRLLKNFEIGAIVVYDPFLSGDDAEMLGVRRVATLDELLSQADVVSLHAPSLPQTRHMLHRGNLNLLRDGAILINTARGALIDEDALYDEAKSGRFTVCLDVTDPEPPSTDHRLKSLPNVVFTPHIAGAVANNIFRQGKFAVTEVENVFSGKGPVYPVKKEDLDRIA